MHSRSRIALVCVCAFVAVLWAAIPAQAALTVTYRYTGAGEETFVVPAGVTSVHVLAVGGSGGTAAGIFGGNGGWAEADIAVTPGQTLYVEVGGQGQDVNGSTIGKGGFNGGADGGSGAGGGGGASDIRTLAQSAPLSLSSRLIVAAGGGGGGASGIELGGDGGSAELNGEDDAGEENKGGAAGTASAGGVGGEGCENGIDGQLGIGGAGASAGSGDVGGGGGGGGLYGGGGGGGGCGPISLPGGAGGGGGSSFVPAGGTVGVAASDAEPEVQITFAPGPVLVPTAPQPTIPATPNTILDTRPAKVVKTKAAKAKVKFRFSSTVAGATFKCKLDKGAFAPCISPKTYKVKPGKHKFSVVAETAGGADQTPATYSFKVVKKKS